MYFFTGLFILYTPRGLTKVKIFDSISCSETNALFKKGTFREHNGYAHR